MADSKSAYTLDDLEFAKLLKCVQVAGEWTMRDVAREMYSSKIMQTKSGAMTLSRFMKKEQIHVNFGDVGDLLNSNIMLREFDITFAYKIIKEICGKIYEDLSEHCRTAMTIFIGLRNELCHDYVIDMNSTGIDKKENKLKEILRHIYQGVAKTLNKGVPKTSSSRISFDKNIEKMETAIRKTMQAKVTLTQANQENKYLDDFKTDMKFKVIKSILQDITHCYDKQTVINPCTWTDEDEEKRFDLDTVYTPPELEDNQGKIGIAELLTEQTQIAGKVGKRKVPNTLIIQGEPGSGKTSLCRFFVHAWRKRLRKVEGLQNFHLVFLVEIRRTSAKSLEEYLRTQLSEETFKILTVKDIMHVLSELNILFIIDGYDENIKQSPALVKDIFENFGHKRIILTTRINAQESVLNIAKMFKVHYSLVDLKGFNTNCREEYITKVFRGMNRDHKGFEMYLNGRGKILEKHLNLPLTIALLIVLWMDNPDNVNNVTTATTLYHELFKLFQKKLIERLITQGKCRGADEMPAKLEDLLLTLGEQAWSMLKDGVDFHLTDDLKEIVERKCRKHKINATEFLSAFLKCEIDENRDEKSPDYFFLHKTQTEYQASLFLANCISKTKQLQEVAVEVEDWKRYEQLLVYLTGNMALRNTLEGFESDILELVGKAEVEPSQYSYWWNIVSESRIEHDIPKSQGMPIQYKGLVHPKVGNILAKDKRFLFKHVAWRPDVDNVAAALRLIALIPVRVESLTIEIPRNIEPFEIPDFLEAIEEVGKHFDKNNKAIQTELLLWRHDSHEGKQISDRFLLATKPWAELTSFTGSLGNLKNLNKKFPKLKNIRCKVMTPECLNSLRCLRDSVRILRITIGFPLDQCLHENIKDLSCKGKLEICFHAIRNEQVNWMMAVVTNLSPRCFERLHLEKSDISIENIELLIRELNGRLESLSISRPGDVDEEREKEFKNKANFRIVWD